MDNNRVLHLISSSVVKNTDYVLYFLQQAQRYEYNHALAFAIEQANALELPLLVYFGLTSNFPEANLRHYTFMAEGLIELSEKFQNEGIHFEIIYDEPDHGILPFLEKARVVVMDIGYTRIQRIWRRNVYHEIVNNFPQIDLYSVESDSIVPVKTASDKEEYGAYTIRRKLHNHLPNFDIKCKIPPLKNQIKYEIPLSRKTVIALLTPLSLNIDIFPSPTYHGGYTEAKKRISKFIENQLCKYLDSNDPSNDLTSKMSMYLHFGQISSLEIFHMIQESKVELAVKDAYVEQLFVRRELAHNYIFYNQKYDQFDGITESWAYRTMEEHLQDFSDYIYDRNDYIHFKTHDPYFNAAMKEMVYTGYMHNYMRMYWAKKIIEWSSSYEEAYEIIKTLNNTYFIDGRDALSFTGIAWCFGKHDRAWTERPILGKLRYMNAAGLERKFNINKYVEQMNLLEQNVLSHLKTGV